jgi:hypothetical protein
MITQFSFCQNHNIRIFILLFCFAALNYVYIKHNIITDNSTVRIALPLSLWENHSIIIDKYHRFSIDAAYRNGHYYSCNAPGISFLVLPAVVITYTILQHLGRTDHLDAFDPTFADEPNADFKLFIFAGTIMVSLFCAFSVAVLYLFFRNLGIAQKTSVLFATVFCFAAPFSCYATTIFNHSLAAAFIVFGLVLGFPSKRHSAFRWIITGLVLAYTVWIEYTAAISVCMLGLFFIFEKRKQGLSEKQIGVHTVLMLFGAVPIVAAFFVYNTLAFGSPFQVGYHFVSTNFPKMEEGVYGIKLPVLSVFMNSLFGLQSGIVWFAPILILSPFFAAYNIQQNKYRTLNIVCLVIPIYYLLLNSAYAYPNVRHITAALPFLIIPVGLAWDSLGIRLKLFTFVFLLISVIIGFVAMSVPITIELRTTPIRILFIFKEFFAGHIRNILYYVGVNAYVSIVILLLVWILFGWVLEKYAFRDQGKMF